MPSQISTRDSNDDLPAGVVGRAALYLAALENPRASREPLEGRQWLLQQQAKELLLENTPDELVKKYRKHLAAVGLSDKTLDLPWLFRASGKSLCKAGDAIGSSIRKIPASDWKTIFGYTAIGAIMLSCIMTYHNINKYLYLKNREEAGEQLEFQNKVSQIILGDTV